jgi:carbonic anhydrase
VKGAVDGVELGSLTGLLHKIRPAIELAEKSGELARDEFVQRVAEKNVEHVVQQIRARSKVLDTMIAERQVGIVGAMYSVQSGGVDFQDMSCGDVG